MPLGAAGEVDPTLMALPRNKARPPESDQMRAGMPMAAALDDSDPQRVALDPDTHERVVVTGALIDGPRHIGRREAAFVLDDPEPDDQPDDQLAGVD